MKYFTMFWDISKEEGREISSNGTLPSIMRPIFLQQMGFLLPDPKCCDPRYKGMTAESIYDILPEDCNSNWDEHLEYGLLERTSRSQQETIDDPSPLELKRIRETLRIEMTREIERFSKSGLLHGNLQGLIEQEIEIADSAKVDWQEILSRFIEGTRRNDFRISLSTRSIFGEESTFHPLELQDRKKSLLPLTLPVP